MLKDMPYSELKKNSRAYEIMLKRDQEGKVFKDIAKDYKISASRALRIYRNIKFEQIRLYINHISSVLGHESTDPIFKIFDYAFECYHDYLYACAYLEKEYENILTDYRDGEPGVPKQFINSMPPFKPELDEQTILRIIEMRDIEKSTFITISKELQITQAKAKYTYQLFYHIKVLKLISKLQDKVESDKEKMDIWVYYFTKYRSSKKRYEALTKN